MAFVADNSVIVAWFVKSQATFETHPRCPNLNPTASASRWPIHATGAAMGDGI